MSLAAQIKQRARELGFDLVGITTADPPPHAAEFRQWLAAGFHGEMGYLARRADERTNPSPVLPGAKSVLLLGMNYSTGEPTPNLSRRGEKETSIPFPGGNQGVDSIARGRIARYAWGTRDYHDLMGDLLRQLAQFIGELGGRTYCYVDTGPILERDLAQRAGIGFIGKHTNLISRRLGNWIFLGEILTSLELDPDEPEEESCGTCHRCLDACPTRAIVAPYRLDARLCISYLTIELKGSIPLELRPLIGDRIFGCDDCLEVCPWNRFARLSPVKGFQRRALPPLTEFLAWDEQQFRDFFRGTPIHRLKRRGLLRNVCVALGNTGDPSTSPALERALLDPELLVREHAAWAIQQIRNRAESGSEPAPPHRPDAAQERAVL